MKSALVYKRILVKFSGEALSSGEDNNISPQILSNLAQQLAALLKLGVSVAVVLGGGNLFRGKNLSKAGLNRVVGDKMGMLATIMNAMALSDTLFRMNIPVKIMSALPISGIANPVNQQEAKDALRCGEVVIFAGGTGNPYFTTDTAASLRAIEIDADLLCKATNVDGIYDADPKTHKNSKRFDKISYRDVLQNNLQVMDKTAICMCEENNLPLIVYDIADASALLQIVTGAEIGTYVGDEK
jgi:uridylate kinase